MGDVARTVYRVDDGDEQEGLTVTVEGPGCHRLAFWSVDRAGNVETENVATFTIGRAGQGGVASWALPMEQCSLSAS